MIRFIKDLAVFLTLIVMFLAGRELCINGFSQLKFGLVLFMDAAFYLIVSLAIFEISLRLMKSPVAFFAAAWAAVVIFLKLTLMSAERTQLTLTVKGAEIFHEGNITPIGLAYELANPFFLLSLLATVLLFRRIFLANQSR